jgi:hypothetical protein
VAGVKRSPPRARDPGPAAPGGREKHKHRRHTHLPHVGADPLPPVPSALPARPAGGVGVRLFLWIRVILQRADVMIPMARYHHKTGRCG